MAEKIPGWLERVLLPPTSEVKGELKAIDAKMDGEFKVLHSEIKRVEETLGTKIDELDNPAHTPELRFSTNADALGPTNLAPSP